MQIESLDMNNSDVIAFLAYTLDLCRDMAAPDMNLPAEMREKQFTAQYTEGKTLTDRSYRQSDMGNERRK